ncbi:hypothetical protein HY632_05115, partial [Candidatus Uhrbacteria bacterium]|nr:hypothetical protein [Candidatus Uhrbacteria bacterium]
MWNEPVSKRLLWAVIFTLAAPSTALFAAEPVASFVAPPVVQFTQESATPPVAPPPP